MLSESFLNPYYKRGHNFPNLLALSAYNGKYSRDGETWTDTIRRVVEGNVALDLNTTQDEAERLFDLFWSGAALPPGRGLWTGGVPNIPVDARYNCAYITLRGIEDWAYCANLLMCGCGVGIGLQHIDQLPTVNKTDRCRLAILCSHSHPNRGEVMPDTMVPDVESQILVEDSRMGWVNALQSALHHAYDGSDVVFNLSSIRPRGAPIKSFGGISCGNGPLATLLRAVYSIVRSAAGRKLHSIEALDVTNHVGVCIKSGNVRRSALIVLGHPLDQNFRDAKKSREAITSHRHSSNNSIVFATQDQIDKFDWRGLVEDNSVYGEPGLLNLHKGRQDDPLVEGVNPCQPGMATVLTIDGIRTFDDINVGSVIWSGERWTTITNKVSTGVKTVRRYRTTAGCFVGTENHRVVERGTKIVVSDATAIDVCVGKTQHGEHLDPQDVIDGLVFGDGSYRSDSDIVFLCIGNDDTSYFQSEIATFIKDHAPGYNPTYWRVSTTLKTLERTYDRVIPTRFEQGSLSTIRGFLRGLYSANGCVLLPKVGSRIVLKASSFAVIEQTQRMLSALGIHSYYTTNKPTTVAFANGNYECKQSYDLSITSGRHLFRKLIGFVQPYKQTKLDEACAKAEASGYKKSPKETYDIISIEDLGDMPVYDITVDAPEHTYWSGGMLVSNCGEILLQNREFCCLSEVYPALCKDPVSALKLTTRYTLRQRLEPVSDPTADYVRRSTMRIGVGLGGICDFEWTQSLLKHSKHIVKEAARDYANELGVTVPIKNTTVKPSGSVSLLNGSSPGIHAPYAPFYLRRTRIGVDEPMANALMEAKVPHEQCVYDVTGKTLVFSFPMKALHCGVTVQNETIRDQIERQVDVQKSWADNAVSCTLTFAENEKEELAGLLKKHIGDLKSVSCLPKAHGYSQPPYEAISADTYSKLHSQINHEHPLTRGGELEIEECATGSCPVK